MFTDQTSAIEESLMPREGGRPEKAPVLSNLRLKNFTNMMDVSDKDDSIWISKKGSFDGKDFLVRISKR
jgi:hypothetical protein